jgi:hypothetical protein
MEEIKNKINHAITICVLGAGVICLVVAVIATIQGVGKAAISLSQGTLF